MIAHHYRRIRRAIWRSMGDRALNHWRQRPEEWVRMIMRGEDPRGL